MGTSIRPSRAIFAAAMIALGIVTLLYGNASLVWQEMPSTLPDRPNIIDLCGVIALVSGAGLLVRPFVTSACRLLFPFLLAWAVLLKLRFPILHPLVAVNW